MDKDTFINAVETMLGQIGEDPTREGLKDTPLRVMKAWRDELFCGYNQDPAEVLSTTFQEVGDYKGPVILKDIKLSSYCEHHILPILGKVHIAYIPNGKVVGISKLARLVEVYGRRLQIQERLTVQICEAIYEHLDAIAVAVSVEAEHLCMSTRGAKVDTMMETFATSGDSMQANTLLDRIRS